MGSYFGKIKNFERLWHVAKGKNYILQYIEHITYY